MCKLCETHGDAVEIRTIDECMQQFVADVQGPLAVGQIRADDRQVEQCGLQLRQLDGDLECLLLIVGLIHHGIHSEILDRVVDVTCTAPAAADQDR